MLKGIPNYLFQQKVLTDLLIRLRVNAGLRQIDLARYLGTPQSFISKYESGERRLDLIEIRKICQACGISMCDFINTYEEELVLDEKNET